MQVLTRRDQLKLKEEKKYQKKQAKAKAKAPAEKPAKKAKAQPKRKVEPPADSEEDPKEEPKPKRAPKRTAKPKPEVEPEETEEPEEDRGDVDQGEQADDEGVAETVKPKRKARAKSQPKKAAEPKAKVATKKAKEPKAKAAPKAKAKAKARAKAGQSAEDKIEDQNHEGETAESEEIKTPKKRLFQGSEDEGEESPHLRRDSKDNNKVKPISEIFEKDKVNEWKATRPKKAERTHQPLRPAAEEKEEKESKEKTSKRKKPALSHSPFAAKENKRRKKRETEAMQHTPVEDHQMQAIFTQRLKNCDGLNPTSLKEYLYKNLDHKFKHGRLNPYFGRPACGVQYALDPEAAPKLSEIVYFGRCGTAKDYNSEAAVCFVQGSLLVPWLNASWTFLWITLSV